MNLTEEPTTVNWPETQYVYLEKEGPFPETAQVAWMTLNKNVGDISKQSKISGFFSLYKTAPKMIYRAGVAVDSKPAKLPPDLKFIKFEGGKYARFVLKGSYTQLPEACGRVFDMVKKQQLAVRDGFFIENYVTDPKTTPEHENVTEILIPIK